jgi:hypothetical protein
MSFLPTLQCKNSDDDYLNLTSKKKQHFVAYLTQIAKFLQDSTILIHIMPSNSNQSHLLIRILDEYFIVSMDAV